MSSIALYQAMHQMATSVIPKAHGQREMLERCRVLARRCIGLRVTAGDLASAGLAFAAYNAACSTCFVQPAGIGQHLGDRYRELFLALAEAVGSLEECRAELHRHLAEIML